MVIASEDIGAAYPMAAVITRACVESAKELGLPEARIPLANATILLATSPKSNGAHDAIAAATEDVQKAFYAVSEKLYQQANPQGGCDPNCGGNCGNDGVVDADYETVD